MGKMISLWILENFFHVFVQESSSFVFNMYFTCISSLDKLICGLLQHQTGSGKKDNKARFFNGVESLWTSSFMHNASMCYRIICNIQKSRNKHIQFFLSVVIFRHTFCAWFGQIFQFPLRVGNHSLGHLEWCQW